MQVSSTMTKDVTPFGLTNPRKEPGFLGLANEEPDQTGYRTFSGSCPTISEISQQIKMAHGPGLGNQHLLLKDFIISCPRTGLLEKLNSGKH